MLTTRWDKSRLIITGAALGIEVLLALYFVALVNHQKADQRTALATSQKDLEGLRNDAGQITKLQADYGAAKRVLSHLEAGIPPDRKATFLPTLLSQLEDLADKNGIRLEVVNPAPQKAATNPTPASAGPKAPATPGGSAAPAAPVTPEDETVSINMTLKGTFASLISFINDLRTFPKVLQIETIQARPILTDGAPAGQSPMLNITMETTATILPLIPGVSS